MQTMDEFGLVERGPSNFRMVRGWYNKNKHDRGNAQCAIVNFVEQTFPKMPVSAGNAGESYRSQHMGGTVCRLITANRQYPQQIDQRADRTSILQ